MVRSEISRRFIKCNERQTKVSAVTSESKRLMIRKAITIWIEFRERLTDKTIVTPYFVIGLR